MRKVAEGSARLLLLVMSAVGAGTAMPSPARSDVSAPIVLDPGTVRIEGWLSNRAEWLVNSTKESATFNPIGKHEDHRCVSVVNATGADRRKYSGFDGKRVIVTGFAVRYDGLPVGYYSADQSMSRRYYKGQRVFNFCHRQLVFVAKNIELKD